MNKGKIVLLFSTIIILIFIIFNISVNSNINNESNLMKNIKIE